MHTRQLIITRPLWFGIGAAAIFAAGCAGMSSSHTAVTLTGSQEVPPVATTASGNTDITVESFKCASAATSSNCPTVFGTVTTAGMNGTAAQIHEGAPGQNGPVIVSLVRTSDNTWSVPSDTTLTDAQNAAYLAGRFYVTVASANHARGEIRAQLRP